MSTEELFRQHSGFVARFLARLGVPPDHVEDALQEVFLVVHRHGGYRPGIAKPTSYLANIAIRAASQYRRRQAVARTRSSEAPLERVASETKDPAHALQTQQDLERFQLALERLPEELRTTLLLVEVEGESCISVAAGLGCPVGTIYWRLHQARKKLQVILAQLNAPRREPRVQPTAAPLDKRAIPMGAFVMFGMFDLGKSESARLLHLAREHGHAAASEAQLSRHRELVRSDAAMPAWANNWAPHPASWISVLGIGPIAVGLTALGVTAALMLHAKPEIQAPPRPVSPPSFAAAPAPLPAAVQGSPVQVESQGPEPTAPATSAEPAAAAPARAPYIKESPTRKTPKTGAASGGEGGPRTGGSAATTGAATSLEAEAAAAQAEVEAPAAPPKEQPARAEEPTRPVQEQGARGDDPAVAEMREVAQAERLLKTDPEGALELARSLQKRFEAGYFAEERTYVEVMALQRLGRAAELKKRGAFFLRTYPDGPYTARVRAALASAGSED